MRSFTLILVLFSTLSLHAKADPLPPLDPDRVKEIAAWLSPSPVNFTPSFDDRAFWDGYASTPAGRALLVEAEKNSSRPVPALTEALFDDYKRSGRRDTYEKPFGERTARLATFVMAQGLKNDGRYLPLIESELAHILDEPSWAVPAHSAGRKNWADAYDNVDLAAAARVWSLATADWLLGSRLKPETRARIRREARARVFAPYLQRAHSGNRLDFWWMNGSNNWNAVCHAGVVGAALLLCEQPAERAEFVAEFENCTRFFVAGYGDDGFCFEGLGYWVYGFGHYAMGAEAIRLATGGHLDLLAGDKLKLMATFDRRWEIARGIYPAFGDASPRQKPVPWLHDFAALRYGGSPLLGEAQFLHSHPLGAFLYCTLFDLALKRPATTSKAATSLPIRDWFPDGGALIVRSTPADTGLAAALKGGSNGHSHGHNDLGSFILVSDGVLVLADLGADTYVRDTFGPKRYTSEVINSFGHPVPRVAGQLQLTGDKARAVTLRTEFTDAQDTWEQDLTSAYDVPGLLRLTRTFVFTRAGGGRLEIIDHARFTTPQVFGTALILRPGQNYRLIGDHTLQTGADGKAITITYTADGNLPLVLMNEPIHGIVSDSPSHGQRLTLDLAAPVKESTIHLTITQTESGKP